MVVKVVLLHCGRVVAMLLLLLLQLFCNQHRYFAIIFQWLDLGCKKKRWRGDGRCNGVSVAVCAATIFCDQDKYFAIMFSGVTSAAKKKRSGGVVMAEAMVLVWWCAWCCCIAV